MTTVLIVDESSLVAEWFDSVFRATDVDIVGTSSSGAEAISYLERTTPDVVLLTRDLPDEDGLRIGKDILARWPRVKLILLTRTEDQSELRLAIELGFHGRLAMATPAADLVSAIQTVATTRPLPGFVGKPRRPYSDEPVGPYITPQERTVLSLIASGLSPSEIAALLEREEADVRSIAGRLESKLYGDRGLQGGSNG
jgi:DNA-binding NarL/FixJ family response regulator